MANNRTRFDEAKEALSENIILDGTSRSAKGKRILLEFLGYTIRQSETYYDIFAFTNAALCVPKGKTAFYKSKGKSNFLLVIKKQSDEKFLVTFRDGKAAITFDAAVVAKNNSSHPEDQKILEAQKIRSVFGIIDDVASLISTASASARNQYHNISKKLKLNAKSMPFLGIAGHEDSPERNYVKNMSGREKIFWRAQPV